MPNPDPIDPNKIQPGPIRNKSLPLELLHQIKKVFDAVGPFIGKTLEQFKISFMRDSDAQSELVVWQSIVAAWQAYHQKFLKGKMLPDAQEKKLLGALILISTGIDDVSLLNVPVDVGRKLVKCYDELGKVSKPR